MTFSFPEKKISVNGVEYTLNSNGVANVTLGPHDAPGDYPLVDARRDNFTVSGVITSRKNRLQILQ